jgi:superfamily II DNA or RNA helicase
MIQQFDTSLLLEPQKDHAIKLADSIFYNGVAWDGSETGTGKSYVGAAIARNFDGPIVVVGPKQILRKWREILHSFGKDAVVYINFEKLCRGGTPWLKYRKVAKKPADKVMAETSTKKFRRFHPDEKAAKYFNAVLYFPAGALVIVDESHRCKGINSLQAGFLMSLKRQGYKVLMLSATQACSPLDMRAFGYVVNLIPTPEMKEYKRFCLDSGAEETGHYGAMTFNDGDDKARRKMASVHHHLFDFSKIGSRLTRDEMGDLFPENEVIAEAYDMGENSVRIQHAFETMEMEIARFEKSTSNYQAHIFAEIMKMRRRVELLKIPTLVEMAEDLVDEGKSVIVFVNFTETIETIKERLELSRRFRDNNLIGLIYGGRTQRQRDFDIDELQADRRRVMLVNLLCAESIGLHDITGRYPRATLVNPSFSAIKVLQAMGRAHRQGGMSKVYQRFVFADHTYENRICERLSGRLDNLELLNDGDLTGGINWFKTAEGHNI